MSAFNRAAFLAILLIAVSNLSALAGEIVLKHNWCVVGPGGHYGVFQYQTGQGPFDAHTALLLGPRNADIPAPLFALIACLVFPFSMFLLLCRGFFTGSLRAANQRLARAELNSGRENRGDTS